MISSTSFRGRLLSASVSLTLAAVLTACGGGGADDQGTATATPQAAPTMHAQAMAPGGADVALSATLRWSPPVIDPSGAATGVLSGYRIYYGNLSGQYIGSVLVADGAASSGVVPGLTSGTWFFAVASVDADGNESMLGVEVSKTL